MYDILQKRRQQPRAVSASHPREHTRSTIHDGLLAALVVITAAATAAAALLLT